MKSYLPSMDKLVQSRPGLWILLKLVSINIWPQPPLNWGLFKLRPLVFLTPKSWDSQITVNLDLCHCWGMQRCHLAFPPLQQLLSLNLFRCFFKHFITIFFSFLIRCGSWPAPSWFWFLGHCTDPWVRHLTNYIDSYSLNLLDNFSLGRAG